MKKMTIMMTTTCECGAAPRGEVARFLADYASWLTGCGATCIRLEKNVARMARAFGCESRVTVMTGSVQVILRDSAGACCGEASADVARTPISYNINTLLSRLSWDVADGKVSFDDARKLFRRIIRPRPRCRWVLLLLVAAANASFCRLFGGDAVAMAVVAVATLAGFGLKEVMTGYGVDVRITVFCCAFVSSVLGATDMLFSIGTTPAVALGTSILYLVPGIPFLNSFSDMICRHYVCALGRFMDAVILTCCLSAGLCAGMALMDAGMF